MLNNLALPEAPDFVSRDSQQLAHDLVGGVAQGRTKIGDAPGVSKASGMTLGTTTSPRPSSSM
jgi:hypothetical protein